MYKHVNRHGTYEVQVITVPLFFSCCLFFWMNEWMNASHDNMHGCWLKWLFLRWKSRFIKKKLKIFLYFLLFWCILKIIFCYIYIYINFFFAESATLTITNTIFMSDINSMGRKERWEFCQSITSYYVRHHLLVDLPVVF